MGLMTAGENWIIGFSSGIDSGFSSGESRLMRKHAARATSTARRIVCASYREDTRDKTALMIN
jgi:hypothetical protein